MTIHISAHGTVDWSRPMRQADLWLSRVGSMAEDFEAPAAENVATVGLARIAIERACLDGIDIVHRPLGLSAFLADHPVERMVRNLQIYLQQPAVDEMLHDAAGFYMTHDLSAG